MLSRSNTINHDQENGTHSHSSHFPTKTPSRPTQQHPNKGFTTAGKGLLTTGKVNRVLGTKDRNQNKKGSTAHDGAGPSALLFTKPSQQSTSTSSCAPSTSSLLSTPAPAPQLPIHLRTPSPSGGIKRMQSLNRMNSETLELEAAAATVLNQEDLEVKEEVEEDREVEYAGGSSRDYDEPYIPDYDFSVTGFGNIIRSLSLVEPPSAEYEQMEAEFNKQDCDFVFVLDDDAENTRERETESKALRLLTQEKSEPLFPTITLSKPSSSALPPSMITNAKTNALRQPFGKKPLASTNATGSKPNFVGAQKPSMTLLGNRPIGLSGKSVTMTSTMMKKKGANQAPTTSSATLNRTLGPIPRLASTQIRPIPAPKFSSTSSSSSKLPSTATSSSFTSSSTHPKPTPSLRISKFSSTSASSSSSSSSSTTTSKSSSAINQKKKKVRSSSTSEEKIRSEEEEKKEVELGIWGCTAKGYEEGLKEMVEGFGMDERLEEGFEI